MTFNSLLTGTLLVAFPFLLSAQESADAEPVTDTIDYEAAFAAYQDSIQSTLVFYADTTISIGDGLAWLTVPQGYQYIDEYDARTVLVDMWGNPPENGENSLGMLFPDKYLPAHPGGYGINIFSTDDGYIDDEEAADMDYDELLESMKEDTREGSEYRKEAGYQGLELLGWAQAPHYDAANQRLHWAKELLFEGEDESTLNYNMLFLGRSGYLTMNVIGGMDVLEEVNQDQAEFLAAIEYREGHRYADFDPSVDDVAAYGIGALIAGKVLAKTGLLATVGLFFAKAWKLLIVAFLAMAGGVKKLFGGK